MLEITARAEHAPRDPVITTALHRRDRRRSGWPTCGELDARISGLMALAASGPIDGDRGHVVGSLRKRSVSKPMVSPDLAAE